MYLKRFVTNYIPIDELHSAFYEKKKHQNDGDMSIFLQKRQLSGFPGNHHFPRDQIITQPIHYTRRYELSNSR
jgi:hypothetical protein